MKGLEFVLLAIGAVIGAYSRYRIVESPITLGNMPVNVLIVNVLGSFILGLFSVISLAFNLDPKYTLFVTVGFCGSFTTMSSFELETVNLVDSHRLGLAALDMAANVGLSFIAVIGGRLLGTAVMERIFW
ncbi:MAG: fluoride efflux transporter CrcB [Candidatus Bathyarchaeota archaeon]|nr:fluoride efflux transporter CrcB [Candidatus Bathyarchaeota archaeon]